ncbi:MAG TPA: AAA family ATPase [Actinomycetota bacterium]
MSTPYATRLDEGGALDRTKPQADAVGDAAAAGESGLVREGVFVGRERELAELVASLDEAFGGRGRLVLLSGEPGIGKRRLADELAGRAASRGLRVLWGRCWEAGGAIGLPRL